MRRIAVIDAESGDNDSAELRFTADDVDFRAFVAPPELAAAKGCAKRLGALNPSDGAEGPALLAKEFAVHTVPEPLARSIRQWSLGTSDVNILCVRTESEQLADLPWEILPRALGLPTLMVVRLAARRGAAPAAPPDPIIGPVAMVLAGWSQLHGTMLRGIERELSSLHEALDPTRVSLTVCSEPPLEQLAKTLQAVTPHIVHLSPPGVSKEPGEPTLFLSDSGAGSEAVPASRLVDALRQPNLRLLVLNTCDSGLSAARLMCEGLGTTVFGWAASVDDAAAADFSFFFYRRLVEGSTSLEAVQAFMQRDSPDASRARFATPVLWFPSKDAIGESLFGTGGVAGGGVAESARSRGLAPPSTPPAIVATQPVAMQIQFEPVPALNPALLKNGRPAIERLTLLSNHEIPNARLTIECDTGNACSVVRYTLTLAKGEHPIPTEGMHFPVLYELSRSHVDRRYVNFVVTASVDGVVLAETTRAVLWMGPKEWMDQPETWAFIPAFVHPENPGVLEIFDEAVKTLKTVDSPTASFDGYQRPDASGVRLQVKALFQTLRDDPFCLNYINPPSSPVYVPGAPSPTGQRVRFPDEITEHKRGTCHDLALLFASCAEHVKVNGLIVIVPGHTFFGYWLSNQEHHSFWTGSEGIRLPHTGASWMITRIDVLRTLLESGAVEFLEATLVTNRNASFEDACAQGATLVQSRPQHAFDAAVDVSASRHAVHSV